MKKPTYKCQCDFILGLPKERLIIHLSGCPEDSWFQEYYSMPWWKRFGHNSPEKLYKEHLGGARLYPTYTKIPDFGRAVISKHNGA